MPSLKPNPSSRFIFKPPSQSGAVGSESDQPNPSVGKLGNGSVPLSSSVVPTASKKSWLARLGKLFSTCTRVIRRSSRRDSVDFTNVSRVGSLPRKRLDSGTMSTVELRKDAEFKQAFGKIVEEFSESFTQLEEQMINTALSPSSTDDPYRPLRLQISALLRTMNSEEGSNLQLTSSTLDDYQKQVEAIRNDIFSVNSGDFRVPVYKVLNELLKDLNKLHTSISTFENSLKVPDEVDELKNFLLENCTKEIPQLKLHDVFKTGFQNKEDFVKALKTQLGVDVDIGLDSKSIGDYLSGICEAEKIKKDVKDHVSAGTGQVVSPELQTILDQVFVSEDDILSALVDYLKANDVSSLGKTLTKHNITDCFSQETAL